MQARYVNDAARGPGWGLLVIRGAQMDAGEACAFSVQRAGDGLHLGSVGWQEAEEVLLPDRVERRGDELFLGVSPAVVDNLDELETYRVILRVEGRPPQCSGLELSAIRYARLVSGDGISVVRPEPEAQPEPVALADPKPLPNPLPTPEPETPPAVPERKKRLLFLLVPGALLAAVSVFLWFWAAPEQASAPLPEQQAEVAPPSLPASPPVRSPKEQARAFLRKGGSPAEALALSRTLPVDTEEGQDAVFLLQESAAEGGSPEAMIRVGRYYDPSDAAPSGTIVKDAEQARLWYDKALQAGAVAVERERLRAWLEGEAAAGSVRAGELLRGMK